MPAWRPALRTYLLTLFLRREPLGSRMARPKPGLVEPLTEVKLPPMATAPEAWSTARARTKWSGIRAEKEVTLWVARLTAATRWRRVPLTSVKEPAR